MRKRVAIVGATGITGQQAVVALQHHPWFEIAVLAASERSAGKSFGEAIRDAQTGARRWWCIEEPSEQILSLPVRDARGLDLSRVDVVFSCVESDVARELEPVYAQTTPVISLASAFRYEPDVPILVPGVNLEHASLLDVQRKRRGWKGFVTPLPNCTTTGLVITLKPLFDRFGIEGVVMTSMQGISGAGRSPGVLALDIVDNLIPFISGEEEKVVRETKKILGRLGDGGIEGAPIRVSATCTRAAVLEGHTESVLVATRETCSVEEAAKTFADFGKDFLELGLPSAPKRLITVHADPYRPQPRLDREADGGMTTHVGRLRPEPIFGRGIQYVLLSHNTKMGAAKGAVLIAEYLATRGYL
jgi:aspartate-semialdehyde dehydrogenase